MRIEKKNKYFLTIIVIIKNKKKKILINNKKKNTRNVKMLYNKCRFIRLKLYIIENDIN